MRGQGRGTEHSATPASPFAFMNSTSGMGVRARLTVNFEGRVLATPTSAGIGGAPTLTGSRVALTEATELVWHYELPGSPPGSSPWVPAPPDTDPGDGGGDAGSESGRDTSAAADAAQKHVPEGAAEETTPANDGSGATAPDGAPSGRDPQPGRPGTGEASDAHSNESERSSRDADGDALEGVPEGTHAGVPRGDVADVRTRRSL